LLGGGMIGLKLHARIKISALGESENEEFTDEIPAADFGVAFGVRFDRGRAYVSSYYNHGLTNTGDDDDEPIKHRVWTTIAGWRF
jgi:hypothetical protein